MKAETLQLWKTLETMGYDAPTELRRALRNNGCCCCNAWCWGNFLLSLALVFQILAIIYG